MHVKREHQRPSDRPAANSKTAASEASGSAEQRVQDNVFTRPHDVAALQQPRERAAGTNDSTYKTNHLKRVVQKSFLCVGAARPGAQVPVDHIKLIQRKGAHVRGRARTLRRRQTQGTEAPKGTNKRRCRRQRL